MTTTRVREAGGTAVLIRDAGPGLPERRVGVNTAVGPPIDIVDLWGMQSFPASDPPANW